MKTKTATPEQKAKAAARREHFKSLVKQIGSMDKFQRAELSKKMLVVSPAGWLYSGTNQILISYQRTGCTIVGGFAQWIKQGRVVSKGETGMMIWVPVKKSDKPEPEPTEDGEEPKKTRQGFMPGTVYDISQTEPLMPKEKLTADDYFETEGEGM